MPETQRPPVRLIATDLDGTLLDSTGKVPERNRDALIAAMERGIAVTISTGRMFSSAKRFAAQIGIAIPLICYNGAMLRYPEGEMLEHLPLDMEIAHRLLAIFRERGMYVQSYVDDLLYIRDPHDAEFQEYMRHFGVTGHAIGDELYRPTTAPTKLLAMTDGIEHSHALIREFSETFGNRLYVTSSNSDFVEIMNPNVNKGRSLAALADSLGIAMEEVMAIGDGENDVEMVSRAGIGIAMGNGREKVKAVARDTAPDNDACGVAWAVDRYALGNA